VRQGSCKLGGRAHSWLKAELLSSNGLIQWLNQGGVGNGTQLLESMDPQLAKGYPVMLTGPFPNCGLRVKGSAQQSSRPLGKGSLALVRFPGTTLAELPQTSHHWKKR
jgi:hypothetical protein